MGCLALATVTTDALMRKVGRAEDGQTDRKSLLGDALTECRAQTPCPAVLHPHTLPPQPHPCSSFAMSSGDPITAIGSESPPGRGSGRAKPERFPDRRVGGGGGTRRGTICPACSCNCTRGEDKPQGSRMKRLALSASTSAWAHQETAAGGVGPLWMFLGRACGSPTVTVSTGPWV